jgi:hypothetical protein
MFLLDPTKFNLADICENINLIDFDSPLKRERKSVQILFRISTLGRDIYRELLFDPESIPPRPRAQQIIKGF